MDLEIGVTENTSEKCSFVRVERKEVLEKKWTQGLKTLNEPFTQMKFVILNPLDQFFKTFCSVYGDVFRRCFIEQLEVEQFYTPATLFRSKHGGVLQTRCSYKFRKIYKKATVLECLRFATLSKRLFKRTPLDDCFFF